MSRDGLVLMYVEDGIVYPVGMTKEQMEKLQFLGKMMEPIRVMRDYPQGEATFVRKKQEDDSL